MELIEAMFRDIDACRWLNLHLYFDEKAIYERPGYSPLEGLNRIYKFYSHERIIFEGRHFLDRCVYANDAEGVCCWGTFEGKSRSGDVLNEKFSDVYILKAGKIVFRRTHFFRPAI